MARFAPHYCCFMKRLFFLLIITLLLTACATVRTASNVPGRTIGVNGQKSAAHPAQDAPLIGISCGGSGTMTTLKTTYSDAVRLAGGVPVLIPVLRDSTTLSELLRRLDAVILSGGEDIDPRYYGEEALPGLGEVNAPRDTFDVLLIRAALRQEKPILAICRSEQVLNVVLGGTLWQDSPSQIPASGLRHRQTEPAAVATQTVTIEPGSRLAHILGTTQIGVNSFHHQAVKDPAPGLLITAWAEDGVEEAYESLPTAPDPYGKPLGRRILAVQFHPEAFSQAGDPVFLKIFQDLVARARQR